MHNLLEVVLPHNEGSLPNLGLSKHNYAVGIILADCLVEIKLRPLSTATRVVFVSDFFVDHPIPTIFLGICRNLPCIFLL